MRTIFTVLALIGTLGFPALMLTITYPFSKKASMFWSNYISVHCAKRVFAIFKCYKGFKFYADEESKKGLPENFIIISNHQSLLDIVVFFIYFGGLKVRFVAKDQLGNVPMVGKMLRCQGHCMIPRKGKPNVAMRTIDKFAKRALENNWYPLIFPEGTRSLDGDLLPFHSAGFRRLCQSVSMPVVLCALDGGWKLPRLSTLPKNLQGGSYHVKVLKVYDAPKDKAEEKHILEEAPVLIKQQLEQWRSEK